MHHETHERFGNMPDKVHTGEYNYRQFRREVLIHDVQATISKRGVEPGELAPDFELPRADGGGAVRLSELRGRPVLLHFGSYTCPVTVGGIEPMKRLYEKWGDELEFVDVLVRQAHPGPRVPAYESPEQKLREAAEYKRQEGIPWTVLVDTVEGEVHQVYGGLSSPAYLIDADGYVAYYNMWANARTLNRLIQELVSQGGRGVVNGGYDRKPDPLPMLAQGWRGIERGLPQSAAELEAAIPGSATVLWVGNLLGRFLAPVANRIEPLPPETKRNLTFGAALAGVALGAGMVAYRRSR